MTSESLEPELLFNAFGMAESGRRNVIVLRTERGEQALIVSKELLLM